ncbi:hypothetical protein FDG2_2170 [Candidatus Protofrankia californiensis]|uniref:Uncharacterized protein n=1 Tax=Candidatus Protofrankia californiensis TaxID=1839754 RepID=A0A1C3NX44_9ACTN|nr:hypothetical protein FDG2_2170 [Candidatus Protofrankia californiensis]
MVAEWIVTLAASGGAGLLGAAATDAWQSARAGVVGLFTRAGDRRQELVADWLDDTAAAVEQADPAERERVRRELLPAWQTRLADLLAEYPEAAEELRAWTAQVHQALPSAQQTWVQNNTPREHGTVYAVQHGTQHVQPVPPAAPAEGGSAG